MAASMCFAILCFVSSEAAAALAQANTNNVPLKRFLAFTGTEATRAVANGARVVRVTRGLKALVCSPALGAALGLMEDIPLQVADSTANAQVLAFPCPFRESFHAAEDDVGTESAAVYVHILDRSIRGH